jgi:hypothetical protein
VTFELGFFAAQERKTPATKIVQCTTGGSNIIKYIVIIRPEMGWLLREWEGGKTAPSESKLARQVAMGEQTGRLANKTGFG